MKRFLIIILISLLLVLSIFIAVQGVSIGNIEIFGLRKIQQKNTEIDKKIKEATNLAEEKYPQSIENLTASTKKLEEEKKSYKEMTKVNEENNVDIINQIEIYEIEALWVKLGNHATTQGVSMQMDLLPSSSGILDTYNLKFTVTGSYISIADFVSAIENDTTLGFKIEEFKMISLDSGVQATFLCRDIAIKEVSSTIDKNDNKNKDTIDILE